MSPTRLDVFAVLGMIGGAILLALFILVGIGIVMHYLGTAGWFSWVAEGRAW